MNAVIFSKTAEQGRLPSRGSNGAAGIDIPLPNSVTLLKGQKVALDLFLSVKLPEGHYGQLALRSSIALRHRLLLHGGVIDRFVVALQLKYLILIPTPSSDFTGSVLCILENYGEEPIALLADTSYVQLIVIKHFTGPLVGGNDYSYQIPRAGCGFGSTEERRNLEALLTYNLGKEVTVMNNSPASAEENDST